jgi:ubiquinone/menaquinone biosynthesis C-methylase UbiE
MCPICTSSSYTNIGKPKLSLKSKNILKKEYLIVQCNNCGYYYINPFPDLKLEEWKYLYDNEYFEPLTNWHLNKRKKNRMGRLSRIEFHSLGNINNFLDVGCGEGFMLLESVYRKWNTYGIDITDHRIESAWCKEINFINSTLTSANFPDNFFDCIYMDSILEHVNNPLEYLKEAYRILKRGGVIYIGVPNEDSLLNDFRFLFNNIFGNKEYSPKLKPFITPYHIGGFNNKSLKFILCESNLNILEFRNFASRLLFRMTEFPSKMFVFNTFLTFINVIAFFLRKENYYEVYATKK